MSDMPKRVQLSRAKGWRIPPNTVKVDRSTKWGNPFVPGSDENPLGLPVKDKRHAFVLYRSVAADNPTLVAAAQAELRGKNLACWCGNPDPYEDACHAAVLLEIANAPTGAEHGKRMARAATLKRLREYERAVVLGEWLGKRLIASTEI